MVRARDQTVAGAVHLRPGWRWRLAPCLLPPGRRRKVLLHWRRLLPDTPLVLLLSSELHVGAVSGTVKAAFWLPGGGLLHSHLPPPSQPLAPSQSKATPVPTHQADMEALPLPRSHSAVFSPKALGAGTDGPSRAFLLGEGRVFHGLGNTVDAQ